MGTRYEINIRVDAFPASRAESADVASSDSSSSAEWKVEMRGGGTGFMASKFEGWVARKLLGNVSKGER